ncbi:MAG: ABC transporter substrate-binding protein [Saprospiraceae bacterium]|nr:ABC transporter substrate-binding protein [Saprospiraceae bacterium]MDW8230119.1 ABC transporter substrate-binding protein [Saprospiraceae bacterium]
MDTIRWRPAPSTQPPIGDEPTRPSSSTSPYRIALLLPFLTDLADPQGITLPERSLPALQFYAGAMLALKRLSETNLNLEIEVLDTRLNDADFQRLLDHPRVQKAQVIVGPMRPSHISLMAERAKQNRQIVISPESPTLGLTRQNPDFIQITPSLRAHGAAIAQHILARYRPENVSLILRRREAERSAFFQPTNGRRFAEILTPDEGNYFDKIDLEPCFRPGQTTVFILPTWGNQDFVMAFFRKLSTARRGRPVAVYGMPQWRQFENIEPEYFADLNVHISSAAYIDPSNEAVRAFQQTFYDAYGTVPDDDAFNGYDVLMLMGQWLQRFGLSFPQRLPAEPLFNGLRGTYRFARVPAEGPAPTERLSAHYDYIENTSVHILRFQNYRFEPAW